MTAARVLNGTDLGKLVEELAARHEVVGASVAVLAGGDVAVATSGTANLRTGVPVTPETVFQIGSVTKVYTATLVMQLVGEGLIDLDEPVASYVPGLRLGPDGAEHEVTVAHLLSHSSGLFGDVFADFGRGEQACLALLDRLVELEAVAPPGRFVSYCNAGYVVLGRIVELLTQRPYHMAWRERLTGPIGADDTVVLPEEAILRPVAIGHLVDPGDARSGPRPAPVWSLSAAQAAAGALPCATAVDLVRFARLHLDDGAAESGERVLAAHAARAMRAPTAPLPLPVGDLHAWGLGWMLMDHDGTPAYGHQGATIGNNASLHVLPDQHGAMAILTNGGRGWSRFHHGLLDAFLEELAGALLTVAPQPRADTSDVDVDALLGTFRNPLFQHTIRRDADGGLVYDTEQLTPVHGAPDRSARGKPARVIDDQRLLLGHPDRDGPGEVAALFDPDGDGRYQRLHFELRAFNRA
ncbi:MAG TPA: serine hydrolase domain-containing protein [Nitriliruptorales bacterium]